MDPRSVEHVNEVRLVGRVAAEPQERTMPSGDLVVGVRLVVERTERDRRPGSPRVDALECSAWPQTLRRSVLRWSPGDVVEVTGRLRRRFQRGPQGPTSRWEIEVGSARRLARAAGPVLSPR